MTAGDSIRRLVVAMREAQLSTHVRAVDPEAAADRVSTGKGGHGSHKPRTTPGYGAERPLYVELEDFLARVAEVVERRLEEDRAGRDLSAPGAKHGRRKRAEDDAILSAVGVDPIDLAYIYRRSTEAIRKLRQRHALDPDTGERVARPRPLTAPARDAFQNFTESATPTPED